MKSRRSRRAAVSLALLTCLCSAGCPPAASAIKGEVLVVRGYVQTALRQTIELHLTNVLNALGNGDLSSERSAFTGDGYQAASQLLERVQMENTAPVHEATLYDLSGGGYEVRDIAVRVVMGNTPGSPRQDLVFDLDAGGRITDMQFAVERQHLRSFRDSSVSVEDFARRQQILHFVELFRTAYNRKDIAFLEQVFSDSALIIVGRVVRSRPDLPDLLTLSTLGDRRIHFLRRSKAEYLTNLHRIFQLNDFMRVSFDSIEVVQHRKDEYLYGVTLRQSWYSGTYADTGWVFLMVDFKESDNPLIHVRSWQPERFEDGSVLSLYHFQVVR